MSVFLHLFSKIGSASSKLLYDGKTSPEAHLDTFIDKFTPEIAAFTRAVLAKMRARLPGALELVYDNYNALAIGFAPSERTSEAILSIAVFPRWVSLFFLQGGPALPDPEKLLKGKGNIVRHIVLNAPADLDRPAIRALMAEALRRAEVPLDKKAQSGIVIKSISAKQRPRRPMARCAVILRVARSKRLERVAHGSP